MTLIYPGGGNCDPNEEPCIGPDCIDPPVGDPDDPIVGDDCLINCGGPTTCTGPDCVNDQCIGPNCSYGEDGDWHAYWICNPDGVGSNVVIAGEANVQEPQNGGLTNFEGQTVHFELSNAGFAELGLSSIQIGDAFQYVDPNDAIVIGEDGQPIVTQYPCYTYLGKKYGATWGQASPPGRTQLISVWATGPTNLASSYGSPATNIFTPYTNYLRSEPCECLVTPDPPPPETGCQDPAACNFNDAATIHNPELCCYVTGCIDRNAVNYNLNACCEDGSCCYISGCTDPTATNYNIEACQDDGSCCYVSGCTDASACEYDENACQDDGSCYYDCDFNYAMVCEHYPGFFRADGYKDHITASWGSGSMIHIIPVADMSCITNNGDPQVGDTYSFRSNGHLQVTYLGIITTSYEIGTAGGLFPGNGNPQAITNGLSPYVIGGVDYGANSADYCNWTYSDLGSAPQWGLIGQNFTFLADQSGLGLVTDLYVQSNACQCSKEQLPCDKGGNTDESGCTDPAAYNYNSLAATSDNSTCEWAVPRWCISSDDNFTSLPAYMLPDVNPPQTQDHYIFHLDALFGYQVFVGGSGSNVLDYFHELGTHAPGGSAVAATLSDAQNLGLTYKDLVVDGVTLQDGDIVKYSFNDTDEGCMRYLGDDIYTGDGSVSFGSLIGPTRVIFGPMRPTAYTYPNVQTTEIGVSCLGSNNDPSGCTDPTATNYDPYAVIEDGTCDYGVSDVYGCTDNTATNHDPLATVDDGSCTYVEASCISVNSSVVLTGLNSSVSPVSATAAGRCRDGELSLTVTGISSDYSDLGMAHPTFYAFDFYKKPSPYTGSSLTEGTLVNSTVVNVSSFPVTLTETGIIGGTSTNGVVQYYRWVARNINCEYASGSYSFGSCVGASANLPIKKERIPSKVNKNTNYG